MIRKLTTALAASLVVASAQAGTVTFNFGLPLTQSTTEITQTGQLGLFDSSLGTLTGASLTLYGGATFEFSGSNVSAQSQRALLASFTDLYWTSSLVALIPFLVDAIEMSATTGFQIYAAGETKVFGPFSTQNSLSDDLGAILGSLQAAGGGQFSLTCESLSGLAVQGGGGNISPTQNTTAGCGASITYTYNEGSTNVPEPVSLALVGMGLLAAGATARRRKA